MKRFAVINIRTDQVLATADMPAALSSEASRDWSELCERRGDEWVSIDGLQRHPNGRWRGGYRILEQEILEEE